MSNKVTDTTQNTTSTSTSTSTQQQQQTQESLTQKLLDAGLLNQIMGGLRAGMTDQEISTFAEALLRPQLNAGLESAQQQYDQAALSAQQQREDIAAQLLRDITAQNNAYQKSIANVENAALARGMGRSSYTMSTLAQQGNALSEVVRQLTDEAGRREGQIGQNLALAGAQNAQTQGRLKEDYAANLAAKIQELRQQQADAYNQNYMTAVSAAMGERGTMTGTMTGTQNTTGTENSAVTGQQYEQTDIKNRYKKNSTGSSSSGSDDGGGSGGGSVGRYGLIN